MTACIKPIKFSVKVNTSGHISLIATFPDGTEYPWGDMKTIAGARNRLSYHAKKYGMKVSGLEAQ